MTQRAFSAGDEGVSAACADHALQAAGATHVSDARALVAIVSGKIDEALI